MKNTANCHQIAIRIEKQNPKLSLSTDTEWNCSGIYISFSYSPKHRTATIAPLKNENEFKLIFESKTKSIMLTNLFKSEILKTTKIISILILFLNLSKIKCIYAYSYP